MHKILAALLIAVSCSVFGAQQPPLPMDQCVQQAPYGFPSAKKQSTAQICRQGYALEHDNVAKIPVWVSYVLTPDHVMGCFPRSNKFAADKSLATPSVPKDYAKSGYDTGHIANADDMRWAFQVEEDSFILSNMTPQLPGFNRGIWKTLEGRVRAWALERKDSLLIYAGPVYDRKQDSTIGKSMVTVPSAFYKIIVDTKTNEAMVFMFPHEASDEDLETFMTSIAEVQKETGIVFPLPNDVKISDAPWPLRTKSIANTKKTFCDLNQR